MVKELRPWALPLGLVYAGATQIRNFCYDQGLFTVHRAPVPVVGVGNLTAGGTGKTPLVAELVRRLKAKGRQPAVVSRGYGSGSTQVRVVPEPSRFVGGDENFFGDEPMMLKVRFPDLPVVIGADRRQAIAQLLSQASSTVDVVIADDVFQHRRLHRDLNLLVLDVGQSVEAYRPLPWGLGREAISSAQRADMVILNKVNLVSPEKVLHLKTFLLRECPELASTPWLEASYEMGGTRDLQGREVEAWCVGQPVIMMCAIGRPQGFFELLEKHLNLRVVAQLIRPDHHRFSREDLSALRRLREQHPEALVAVTEKDAVKLRQPLDEDLRGLRVVGIELKFRQGERELDQALDRLFV